MMGNKLIGQSLANKNKKIDRQCVFAIIRMCRVVNSFATRS